MLNLLLFLVLAAIVGILAAWIAETPGHVSILWHDWQIDTSFAFLVVVALVAACALAAGIILLRAVVLAPYRLRSGRSERRYRKGLQEITHSVAALAASDPARAEKHTSKARKLLGETPLTLLLSAQVARNKGDSDETRLLMMKMLDHTETEFLAARSLSEQAGQQKSYGRALDLAQRAQRLSPKHVDTAQSVIGLHLRMGQWAEAQAVIETSARKQRWGRAQKQRLLALVHLLHGRQLLASGEVHAAWLEARFIDGKLKGFAPAAVFSAKAHEAAGHPEKALRRLLKAWREAPHPEIAAQLRILTSREPKARQLQWARKLKQLHPHHPHAALALAEAAVKLQEWAVAREALVPLIEQQPSAQACKLMAYVEQGQHGDFEAAGRWLAKSAEAPADAAWQCKQCGSHHEQWHMHCPRCDAFDSVAAESMSR